MTRDQQNQRLNNWLFKNYGKVQTGNQEIQSAGKFKTRPANRQRPNLFPALVQKIAALKFSGLTQRKIAELLSISISSVNKILNLK